MNLGSGRTVVMDHRYPFYFAKIFLSLMYHSKPLIVLISPYLVRVTSKSTVSTLL